MRLKSLTLKGFKSFPDRTCLDFGPGVSVVVGPNGSGKSNVTDAVLWAMGEQSPLAVRGQSMQDVIFGGGRGVSARTAAEVEIVLDNSDGTVDLPLSEISILRRLDRTGEGGYRLNGARCRLSDVIEVLSDTGLGKETHSVISQGRVEAIVTSKPRERRLLIEEAAGLGKHRKRRRRAQLKLDRTQENLDRALDVEREARTRLRPLKRQAEAAELHARLERQMLEARLTLAHEAVRSRRLESEQAEAGASEARAARERIESALREMADRRGLAEQALAQRAERHEALSRRASDARSASERLALRAEQVGSCAQTLERRIERNSLELSSLDGAPDGAAGERDAAAGGAERISELEAALAEIDAGSERELEAELADLLATGERERVRVEELASGLASARQARERADELVEQARAGSVWAATWKEVRRVIEDGVRRVLAQPDERARMVAAGEVAVQAEHVARGVVEYALKGVRAAEQVREEAEATLREAERRFTEAGEQQRRTEWLIEQRRAAPRQGPLALRRAQLEGELAVERREAEERARRREARVRGIERRRELHAADMSLLRSCTRLDAALAFAVEAAQGLLVGLEAELAGDRAAGEEMAGELSACAREEAEIHARLRGASEAVTAAEVAAQRLRDHLAEAELELDGIVQRLGLRAAGGLPGGEVRSGEESVEDQRSERSGEDTAGSTAAALEESEAQALHARVERLARRREQLGPVNPLAQEQYSEAAAHVEELEGRRADLETALRELRAVIRDTDRRIEQTFEETFQAAAQNFEELVGEVFPGGSGRLRLVRDEQLPRSVLGGQPLRDGRAVNGNSAASSSRAPGVIGGGAMEAMSDDDADATEDAADAQEALEQHEQEGLLGVEIEITPAGKATKRLSLLSGGEKSMTALAFLFAVFLARPCPFYILDEVEAALDDLNLDRFLALLRRYSERAQFIVITHQKRTMEAADWLYGVSMGGDGVSKVLSRRLPAEQARAPEVAEVA